MAIGISKSFYKIIVVEPKGLYSRSLVPSMTFEAWSRMVKQHKTDSSYLFRWCKENKVQQKDHRTREQAVALIPKIEAATGLKLDVSEYSYLTF